MLKFKLVIPVLFAFILFSIRLFAQQDIQEEKSFLPFYKEISIDVKENTEYHDLNIDFEFSSIAFSVPGNVDFPGNAEFRSTENNTYILKKNEHSENPEVQISNLIILEKTSDKFSFFSGNYSGKLNIHLHYAPSIKINYSNVLNKRKHDSCEKPESIPISIWRNGLPAPAKKPASTKPIEHFVIHHAAGSNTDTDYVKTVRNIYLYHTQSNGWDDIGYNYLVAPNGDVFDGRDPQGVDAQDYILGAHFCGKNSNTIGICMLGDLSQQAPSTQAVESLKIMLAWKLRKDNLNPLDSILHPKNNPSAYLLGTIAGHRNGCATECPGDYMYALIPVIKEDVKRIISGCSPATIQHEISENKITLINLYPNPATLSFIIENKASFTQNLKLINMMGQTLKIIPVNPQEKAIIDTSLLPQGLYFIKADNINNFVAMKLFIQH